jgi:hypothetical protein
MWNEEPQEYARGYQKKGLHSQAINRIGNRSMTKAIKGTGHYLTKFSDQCIVCNQYALSKLGVDRTRCFLKIDNYMILCVPFQFSFKRSLFLAALNKYELAFFQRYINRIVGLSITFKPEGSSQKINFFIHCNLSSLGLLKNRENMGLVAVDFKSTPTDFIIIIGEFLENQARIQIQYEDYGKNPILMTPMAANLMGYNRYAAIAEPHAEPRRIQIHRLSTKTIEYLEHEGAPQLSPGTSVAYQLYFKKYRISVTGQILSSTKLDQGVIQTVATLELSPELVELIDIYWYSSGIGSLQKKSP